MTKAKILTSDAVGIFVKNGGQILYLPKQTDRGWEWELWGLRVGLNKPERIISSKTGEYRVFKSADALIRFHHRLWPDEKGVFVEFPMDDN